MMLHRQKYWQLLLFSLLIVLLMYHPLAHSRGIPRTRNSSTTWSGLRETRLSPSLHESLLTESLDPSLV